jgi:hypothetical protein
VCMQGTLLLQTNGANNAQTPGTVLLQLQVC